MIHHPNKLTPGNLMIFDFSSLIPEHTSDQQISMIAGFFSELSAAFDSYYYTQIARHHRNQVKNKWYDHNTRVDDQPDNL